MADMQQEDLFPDLPQPERGPGWIYASHMFQKTGPPLWKLGYTTASPLVRARQIACVAVAWRAGTMRDERHMHKTWKVNRVSPAAEFFRHGDALDRHVLWMISQMPKTLRDRQFELFAEIMLRLRREGYGDEAA